MDNINGGLGFRASLDIDDFNVSAQAMERRIQQVSSTAQQESAQMETMFGKAATAFAGIVGIGAAKSFVQQMIQVRSEMQNTEASFKVFLGTASKANEFFNDLQRYAYNNIFEFADLAKNANQLLAFRNDVQDVIPILDKLSNIAAGANAPLSEFVTLWNKAKSNNKLLTQDIQMWESRGVPVVYELAEAYGKSEQEIRAMVTAGKIGFKDVETVVTRLTDRGGMFAGMMVEKMKTLGDSIGLLEDSITNMFNQLGASNQGVLRAAILGANSLVENYEKVGQVLGSLVIAYGTYKAAVIATNLAQKSETGITVLDNTVRSIKLTVLKAEAAASGKTIAATEAMTAAEEQHLAALQASLTAEEQATILRNMRAAAIATLLTAQQQEYLSNLNLTVSSEGYEAAAMGVLTVEQQEALSKMDLSTKSQVYKAAVESEVAAKERNVAAMRQEVSAAYARMEAYKDSAIAANAAVESARYEVYWAKQSGDATRIATAEKKLEAAEENASAARKAALGAQTEFLAQKKQLEATTSRRVTTANAAEAASETADAVAKGANTVATHSLTTALKVLWTTIKANPLGWIIGILGAIVSLFTLFRHKSDEAKTATEEFTESTKKEIDTARLYKTVLETAEEGSKAYTDAKQKLNTICKQYNVTLLDEKGKVKDLEAAYNDLTKAIQKSAKAKISSSNAELIQREASETEEEALKQLKKSAGKAKYVQSSTTVQSSAGAYTQTNFAKSENIRGASEAIWEGVETLAMQASQKLTTLDKDGEQYAQAFGDALNDIVTKVQTAIGASDKEIEAFKSTLSNYLDTVVEAERTAQEETAKMNGELDSLFQAPEDSGSDNKPEYAKMTFEELEQAAKDAKDEIALLDKSDTAGLENLTKKLKEIQSAIFGKEAGLNTESSINARIKQLKSQKEQSQIGSQEYKDLDKSITSLQKKLPKSQESLSQKAEQLRQKELAAQRSLEEAKIELMEDGFEKQQASMELQHKRNLDAILKERAELLKARKASGYGGLTADQEAGFTERTDAENKSYARSMNNLVDQEISYKKQQYELYWKWVDKLGKDVADTQFKDLIKGGESYKAWVDAELGKLGTQDENGNFVANSGNSESDNKRFMLLGMERDEIMGSKSAMDLFTESLTRAIQEAGTLADRIQVIADAKEKIANGESGLNEDEQAVALVDLNEKDAEYQRELQNTVLEDFKSYEEKKNQIVSQYAALRLTEQAQSNQELLERINKGEADALSELEVAQLQASTDWQNLFQNLDTLTASQIQKLVDNIQGKLLSTNLKLAPADYKALIESLNQAKERIVQLNPFKALGKSFSDYITKLKELKQAQKKNLSDTEIQKYKAGVVSAAQEAASAIAAITQVTGSIGDTIAGVADSFGADGKTSAIIEGVSGALGGVGKAAGGAAKIMSGDLIGGITDVISGIGDFIISLNGMSDAMHEENIKDLQEEIDALADAYDNLGDAIERAYSTNKANLLDEQTENLRQQNEKIRQQIQEEEDKKKTDSERIKEWEKQIAENEKQIAENTKYNIVEAIMGSDVSSAIDEFANAYADAWANGEKAAKKSAETVKNIIKTAIIEQLKNKLQPEVEAFMTYMAEALKDGVITEAEEAMLDEYQRRLDEQQQEYLQKTGKWLKGDETQEDAMTGAVRGMSEETGGIVAGRLNAVVINQSQQLETVRAALEYQAQIAQNTGNTAQELREIKADLRDIKNRESSLLSQGIS